MERAIAETDRRREKQEAYNAEHGITPTTIKRNIADIVARRLATAISVMVETGDEDAPAPRRPQSARLYRGPRKAMRKAAADLEFEEAGRLRDEIRRLEADELGLPPSSSRAPVIGHSNEGKPGTRKTRYGKQKQMRMGRRAH